MMKLPDVDALMESDVGQLLFGLVTHVTAADLKCRVIETTAVFSKSVVKFRSFPTSLPDTDFMADTDSTDTSRKHYPNPFLSR